VILAYFVDDSGHRGGLGRFVWKKLCFIFGRVHFCGGG
jgi:hypothetical protein